MNEMQRSLIVACARPRRVPAEVLRIRMSNVKIEEEGSCMSHNAPAPAPAHPTHLPQTCTGNPWGVWNITVSGNKNSPVCPVHVTPGGRFERPAAATAQAKRKEHFIVPLISGGLKSQRRLTKAGRCDGKLCS